MTTTHNFQPGDRVICEGGARELEGLIGTIVEPPIPERPIAVKFDHDFPRNMIRSWSNARYIKSAPITVGSWVRIIGPTADIVEKYKGHVSKVTHVGSFDVTIERISSELFCKSWTASNLRVVVQFNEMRVYPPKPQFIGLDLASGPDKSHLQVFGRGTRALADQAASTSVLKQAQHLAETLDRKHFGGNLKVPTHLVDCLNAIDSMTTHMTRIAYSTPQLQHFALKRRDDKIAELEAQVRQMRRAIDDAAQIMKPDDGPVMKVEEWLRFNAPERLSDGGDIPEMTLDFGNGVKMRSSTPNERHAAEVKRLQSAIDNAAKLFRAHTAGFPRIAEWLAEHAPEPTPPAFQRGDLVVWGDEGVLHARIVTLNVGKNHEVMMLDGTAIGAFRYWPIAELRHAPK